MSENYDTGQFEEDCKDASALASQNERYETALYDSAFEGEAEVV